MACLSPRHGQGESEDCGLAQSATGPRREPESVACLSPRHGQGRSDSLWPVSDRDRAREGARVGGLSQSATTKEGARVGGLSQSATRPGREPESVA